MRDRFATTGTNDIANGLNTKAARKDLPQELHRSAQRKLTILMAARELEELNSPPGNRLEPLKGNRIGFHSIRINNQWRIVFRWEQKGATAIEICDYH